MVRLTCKMRFQIHEPLEECRTSCPYILASTQVLTPDPLPPEGTTWPRTQEKSVYWSLEMRKYLETLEAQPTTLGDRPEIPTTQSGLILAFWLAIRSTKLGIHSSRVKVLCRGIVAA